MTDIDELASLTKTVYQAQQDGRRAVRFWDGNLHHIALPGDDRGVCGTAQPLHGQQVWSSSPGALVYNDAATMCQKCGSTAKRVEDELRHLGKRHMAQQDAEVIRNYWITGR